MFADLQHLTVIMNHGVKLFKISHIIKKYREKVLLLLFPYICFFAKTIYLLFVNCVFKKLQTLVYRCKRVLHPVI